MTPLVVLLFVVVFAILMSAKVVARQTAYIPERLGKFYAVPRTGINFMIPVFNRIAYKYTLKGSAPGIPEQVSITCDQVQARMDGVIFSQFIDPKKVAYGLADYFLAVIQRAPTSKRSEMGKLDLNRALEERMTINRSVVESTDEAAIGWGVKMLGYAIIPRQRVLISMEKQLQSKRERSAIILLSDGEKQAAINIDEGQKQKAVLESEAIRLRQINKAEGQAVDLMSVAGATAESKKLVRASIQSNGGAGAVQLQVAEHYMEQFGKHTKAGDTLILPTNLGDMNSMMATALTVVRTSSEPKT